MNEQNSKPKRVAIYVRVSTQDQSTEMQVKDLTAFVEARGWTLVRVFEDKSTGTTTKKRTQLAEILTLANQRQIDIVLVWKMDRFARSLTDLVTMLNQLQDVGVEFVSLKDSIDLTTAHGRLMMQLLGAFGEFEASMIRERVRAGLQNAKRKGVILGRPSFIDVSRVQKMKAQGNSLFKIAMELGVSKSGVAKVLRQPIGKVKSP